MNNFHCSVCDEERSFERLLSTFINALPSIPPVFTFVSVPGTGKLCIAKASGLAITGLNVVDGVVWLTTRHSSKFVHIYWLKLINILHAGAESRELLRSKV